MECRYCNRQVEDEFKDVQVCGICINARHTIDATLHFFRVPNYNAISEMIMHRIRDAGYEFSEK